MVIGPAVRGVGGVGVQHLFKVDWPLEVDWSCD